MRIGRVGGFVLAVIGTLWSLQGIGVAKGSPMTDHIIWTVIGAPIALAGLVLLARDRRRRRG